MAVEDRGPTTIKESPLTVVMLKQCTATHHTGSSQFVNVQTLFPQSGTVKTVVLVPNCGCLRLMSYVPL